MQAHLQRGASRNAPGSWYACEVQRWVVGLWMHGRMPVRRAVEMACSMVGHQERWQLWHVLVLDTLEQEPS